MPQVRDEPPNSVLQFHEVTLVEYAPTDEHKVSLFRKFEGEFLMIELPGQRMVVQSEAVYARW